MKNHMIEKLTGSLVLATLLLFGSNSEALTADLKGYFRDENPMEVENLLVDFKQPKTLILNDNNQNKNPIEGGKSLGAFNLQETLGDRERTVNGSEASNSAINQWVNSIYYLMMGHLTLSFILYETSEEL